MDKAILVYLGLGSNLGNRLNFLNLACKELQSEFLNDFRVSTIYESEPLLKMLQPNYYNVVVCGLTKLSPFELFQALCNLCVRIIRFLKRKLYQNKRPLSTPHSLRKQVQFYKPKSQSFSDPESLTDENEG